MKPSLYICRSPLQLLNCIEACEQFGLRDGHNVLVCAWRAERDRDLMRRLLEHYPHWAEVHFFPLYPTRGQVPVMFRVFRRHREFAHLFFGDTTHLINVFLNKVARFDAIHMVDDGTATLHRARQIAERTLHLQRKNFTHRHPAASALLAGLGLSSMFHYRAKLFTIYDIPQPEFRGRVVRNTLAYCKSHIGEKPRSGEVWFIGSNIRREVLINPDDYDDFLEQVHRRIDLSTVVYIPHRKEPDDYLATISRRYGMEIRRLQDILEIELVNAPTIPAAFVSFGSSAVDTIDILVHPPITVFRIPEIAIEPTRIESVRGMYHSAVSKGFEVIDLEAAGSASSHQNLTHA